MANSEEARPLRSWVWPLLTTLIGLLATFGVGWYQLGQSEDASIAAEQEKSRGIRQSLVAIVEEHVLNDTSIDAPRLARLIDERRREERVSIPIGLNEVIQQAEFNVLNSRYLAFARKQELKVTFDLLYSDLGNREFQVFPPSVQNYELLNTVAVQIREGKSKEALGSLKKLQEEYARGQADMRAKHPILELEGVIYEIGKNPLPVVFFLLFYVFLLTAVSRIMRVRVAQYLDLLARRLRSIFPKSRD